MSDLSNILVWLPTYNEEESVASMIDQLEAAGLNFVVCDGFSTDHTADIAGSKNAVVISRSGFGKGFAVRDGIAYATANDYEGLVLIDCDQTYAVEDIFKLVECFEGHDMVVGSRDMTGMYFLRRWANHLMTFCLNVLYGANSKDMASGLRLLRVSKFTSNLSAESFDIEPQMYSVALAENYRIHEIPISYHKRTGNSKVNILHLVLLIWRMVQIRLSYIFK